MFSYLNGSLILLLGLFGYTWVGYPLLLLLFSKRTKRTHLPQAESDAPAYHIHIIIAAYNEESVIEDRIRNLQTLDFPQEHLSVYVGTDGCTDATAAVARDAAQGCDNVHIQEYAENRGKVAVLKDLVNMATLSANSSVENASPLLVFSDANTAFAPDALTMLMRHFPDPHVGGVCGRLIFTTTTEATPGAPPTENPTEEGAYWRLETFLKKNESTLDSCLGANGAIYAIRPELFWHAIPTNTIVDDLVIGMKIREQGFLMRYEPAAIASEEIPDIEDEWGRRVRIGAGDYQAAILCRDCLKPSFGWFAWSFWSHKILRWLTPHILILIGTISYTISIYALYQKSFGSPLAYVAAIGMSLMLVAGHLGNRLRRHKRTGLVARVFSISEHFVSMHAALFVGFIRFCRGNMSGAWKRTPRS
jgi:cellulose synthase/poly-beta-1,6-N-acetylglucosamine synthase-like glycosyltransferase